MYNSLLKKLNTQWHIKLKMNQFVFILQSIKKLVMHAVPDLHEKQVKRKVVVVTHNIKKTL